MKTTEIDYLIKKCEDLEEKLLVPCKYKELAYSFLKTSTLDEFIEVYNIFKAEEPEFHIFSVEHRETDNLEELKKIVIYNLIEQVLKELHP